MNGRMPRRQRLLLLAAGAGVLFLGVSAWLVWRALRPPAEYRPGEAIEGLTADLRRSIPEGAPRITFTDVAAEAGIEFRHFRGTRSVQLPEDMGSGAAWGDYDRDGWPDLFVVNESGPLDDTTGTADPPARSALYHNEGNGTFSEVAARAGVAVGGLGMGAAWGDYDADGWPDLVVTAYGGNRLFRNRGDGTFEDVTAAAGLSGEVGFWTGASWADYDRDGDLDLYITGYVRYSRGPSGTSAAQYVVQVPANLNPSSFPPERNLLYRNEGDGRFADVSDEAGVGGRSGRSLSAAWSDFDGDGWPDLYVANDLSDNFLFRNPGDGTLEDVSYAARVADYRGAMGLAVGDWDGDLDPDLFVTHWIAQENALFENLTSRDPGAPRPLGFMDVADRFGLGQIALDFVGWGTSFIDYDNDGRLDLFVANGSTLQQPERPERLVGMRDQLFWNAGPEDGFYDVSDSSGAYFSREDVGRGAAFADYDRDGDVDVFVVNNGGRAALLRNDGGNRNAWLEVRLEGTRSNRSAYGTKVRAFTPAGPQVREVGAQSSYLSQSSPVVHFGLGPGGEADSLLITWPSGVRQVVRGPLSGRIPDLREAEGAGDGGRAGGFPAGGARSREETLRFWDIYRRATAARTRGRPGEAADAYEAALVIDPAHEDALYYLGNVRLELGDLAGAERAWRRLVEVAPMSARGHASLGRLYACFSRPDIYDPDRAEAELRRAFEINAEETGPVLGLGIVALLRHDLGTAVGEFDAVAASNPRSVIAPFLSGYVAWSRGDTVLAREALRAAMERARAGRAGAADSGAAAASRTHALPCRTLETEIERAVGAGAAKAAGAPEAAYGRLARLLAAVP
ncbi:MAG: FG-GAP-like repeat-containing protein [Gemmatimonadota bacterium]